MSRRLIISLTALPVIGAGVCAYFFVPLGTADIFDEAHAAVGAIFQRPGDPDNFNDRLRCREFDLASQVRQTEGASFYHHPPSGEVTRTVVLPPGMPDGAKLAQEITAFVEKSGLERDLEARFPLLLRTDSHAFHIQPVATQGATGPGNAVSFSFEYTGFIRQGEPRKIADYAESVVRKEVNSRCWSAPGFVADPPHVPDVSPTAVVTDLPRETDTAAEQAKIFKKTPSALASDPPTEIAETPSAPPHVMPANPAPYRPAVTAAQPEPPPQAAGSDLTIKKPLKIPKNTVVLNGMDYATVEDVKSPDKNKLLDQGQKAGTPANGSPLDQPADHTKVHQDQDHPQ